MEVYESYGDIIPWHWLLIHQFGLVKVSGVITDSGDVEVEFVDGRTDHRMSLTMRWQEITRVDAEVESNVINLIPIGSTVYVDGIGYCQVKSYGDFLSSVYRVVDADQKEYTPCPWDVKFVKEAA